MNRKQFTILIVVLAVIGAVGLIVNKRRSESWVASGGGVGDKLVPNLPVNDVAQVHVKSSSEEVHLVKTNEAWRVQERSLYPANFTEIQNLLLKLSDLKVSEREQVGSNHLGRLELLPPGQPVGSGTLLELKDASSKAIQTLILGKTYSKKGDDASPFGGGGFAAGRWILAPGKSGDVALVNEPLSEIHLNPAAWLDKEFFRIEKTKSITMTSTNAADSWKIFRDSENGEWKLADVKPQEKVDTNKLVSVGPSLSFPSFEDVKPASAPAAETGLDKPLKLTFETFENFVYQVEIGRKDAGGQHYHLKMDVSATLPKERTAKPDEKPEDKQKADKEFSDNRKRLEEKLQKEKEFGKWIYLVQNWSVDPVVKVRADFMAKEEPAPGAAPGPGPATNAAPIRITPAPKAVTAPPAKKPATNAAPSAPKTAPSPAPAKPADPKAADANKPASKGDLPPAPPQEKK